MRGRMEDDYDTDEAGRPESHRRKRKHLRCSFILWCYHLFAILPVSASDADSAPAVLSCFPGSVFVLVPDSWDTNNIVVWSYK